MNKRDLIDSIVIILIVCILTIWNGVLKAKNDLKQNRINELEQQVERCRNLITAIIMILTIMILLVSYQLGLYLKELETKQENIRKLSIENEDLKEQIYVLQMKGDN